MENERIFNEEWVEIQYLKFKSTVPRVSNNFSIQEFQELIETILFISSKEAESQFFLSDKTIKKIKDLLRNSFGE